MKRKYFVFLLIVLALLGLGLILCYPLWLNVGSVQTQLDEQFSPTAEYILAHPPPTPVFIDAINPPIGSRLEGSEEICVAVLPGGMSDTGDSSGATDRNVASSLRIRLNGQLLPVDTVRVEQAAVLRRLDDGRLGGEVWACFTRRLQSGYHLLQIETRNSPFGVFGFGDFFSYTWAYFVS